MLLGPGVDAPTLLLAISMFGFLLAGVSLSDSSALPAQRTTLRLWSRAMLASGVACLLFYLRGHIPWALSFGLGNATFLALPVFSVLAHAQLLKRTVSRRWVWGTAALGLSGVAANLLLDTASRWGVMTVSVAYAGMHGVICAMLLRDFARRRLPAALAGTLFIALIVGMFVLRAVRALLGDVAAAAPSEATHFQAGLLLLGMVSIVGTSIAFFSMVHASQREALLEAFRRDGLTGVYSRTAFFERAIERLQQHPALPHAVVMVDLDRFKQVNDTFGHAAGDATLVHAARAMGQGLRSVDLLGRYGGEEFCVLVSGCDEAATQLAGRLVEAARSQQVRLPDGRVITYTLSAGCAEVATQASAGGPAAALSKAMEMADAALYRAKQAGRDRAMTAASATELTSPAAPIAWQSA